MQGEKTLLDYFYVLIKWRKIVIWPVIAVGLLSAAVSLALPERWKAVTVLLPSEEDPGRFEMSMLLSPNLPGGLGGLLGQATPGERLLTILQSRRVLGAMVDRFGLVEDYGVVNRDMAIETLDELMEAELSRDGALTISVEGSSPSLAADMANALAAELDVVIRKNKRQQADGLRLFLSERMETVQGEIEVKARAIRDFQEGEGIIDVQAQTTAMVELTKSIVNELALLEVKLGIAKQSLKDDHEDRILLEMEAVQLRGQLQRVVGRELDSDIEGLQQDTFNALGPPLREWPSLGLEYAQLTLELKIAEQVLAFLAAQLEDAKYRQAENAPTLQVLDPATVPEFRSAPSRALIVLIATGISLVAGILLAFLFESFQHLSSENRDKIEAIRQAWTRNTA
ncbi:MAG: Wzz/FepE/Etk N-terminal domain-containing protein [Candidatus Latescibacterota bacterium]|nr:Wzz/FepE/Etk N-terminal domain-containing protein [Candidatus Latescibacterota bacterium]